MAAAFRRRVVVALVALVLLWGVGLARFVAALPQTVAAPDRHSDAIVVLTGGSGRLAEGLALLERGLAGKLFVSGVYRGVDVEALLRVTRADGGGLASRIDLGHQAADTRGNARETAQWMAGEGFASLRLVTAAYHMPRSLLELARAMPGVEIIAHPVHPSTVPLAGWWRRPRTVLLLSSEYGKYLLSRARGWTS